MRVGLAVLLALAACRQTPATIIDGSSPEAFARTTAAARGDLPAADRLAFDAALRTIAARRYANRDPEALARVTFDGMTAREVVADQREREH